MSINNIDTENYDKFNSSLEELNLLVTNENDMNRLYRIKEKLLELYLINEYYKVSLSNSPEGVVTIQEKKEEIEETTSNKIFSRKNFIILNLICWVFCFIALFMLLSSLNYKNDTEKVLNEFKEEALKERQTSYDEGYILGIQENSFYWNNVLNHINSNIELALDLNNDVGNEYILLPTDEKIKDYSSRTYTENLKEALYQKEKNEISTSMNNDIETNMSDDLVSDEVLSEKDKVETVDVNAFFDGTGLRYESYVQAVLRKHDLTEEERKIVYDYLYDITYFIYNNDTEHDISIEVDWITMSDDLKIADALGDKVYYDLIITDKTID